MTSRESISLASLTGRKVGKEAVNRFGHACNVPISTPLVCSHINARRKYHERIENEKKEREAAKKKIRDDAEATRKRKAKEQEEADYQSKIKRIEGEEKEVRDTLKFDQARRKELEDRMTNTQDPAEMRSSFALLKPLSASIDKNRATLDELSKKKFKLAKSHANKKK